MDGAVEARVGTSEVPPRLCYGRIAAAANGADGETKMPRPQRYVNEKLGRALRRLNTRRGSLGKRVRDAWEEMHVLEVDELVDAASREDFRGKHTYERARSIGSRGATVAGRRIRFHAAIGTRG